MCCGVQPGESSASLKAQGETIIGRPAARSVLMIFLQARPVFMGSAVYRAEQAKATLGPSGAIQINEAMHSSLRAKRGNLAKAAADMMRLPRHFVPRNDGVFQ